jgi:hypothetical protein
MKSAFLDKRSREPPASGLRYLVVITKIEYVLAIFVLLCLSLYGQTPSRGSGRPATCFVERGAVRLSCPENWNIVDEYHDPYKDETIIGNFPRKQDSHNRISGPGMATISVSTLPKGYENLERWIWVGRKNAPDAIESKLDVLNDTIGKINVVCMSGPTFSSYFFQVGKTPLLLEIGYRAQDPKKDEYRAAVRWMIEQAVPVH